MSYEKAGQSFQVAQRIKTNMSLKVSSSPFLLTNDDPSLRACPSHTTFFLKPILSSPLAVKSEVKGSFIVLYLARGYSTDFTPYPLVTLLSSIWQSVATDGAHNFGPGTHLFSWVERGTICVNILPKDAILKCGRCWFRTHDPWVVNLTPYHYATEATNFAKKILQ